MRLMWLSGLFLLCAIPAHAESAWNWNSRTLSARADITGDGKSEKIRLEKFVGKDKRGKFNRHYFRLMVNSQSIYDDPFGRVDSFILADIDNRDGRKEIVVTFSTPDGWDWNSHLVYGFDGKTIHRGAREPLMLPHFYGNGRVMTYTWTGYQLAEIPYRLGHGHVLCRVPGKYFKISSRATLKKSVPIYERPDGKCIAVLKAGTKVKASKTDLNGWFYLRSNRGVRGWINHRWNNISSHLGWPAAG